MRGVRAPGSTYWCFPVSYHMNIFFEMARCQRLAESWSPDQESPRRFFDRLFPGELDP